MSRSVITDPEARTYDRLFDAEFPYAMAWHPRPFREPRDAWTLHVHFPPPLLRSATVEKFKGAFELLGMPQRDLTAEAAAACLRGALAP